MGIIALCFDGGFHSVYPCWLLPHSYEGNPVQSYSGLLCGCCVCFSRLPFGRCVFSRVMVVGLFTWSWDYFHGLGINVSQKSVLGWPLCQDICFMVVG
jgi:hypothetical protein